MMDYEGGDLLAGWRGYWVTVRAVFAGLAVT